MNKQIVIVGGGFGGVKAALKLANKPNISVRLVTTDSYFEYYPALYRTATGKSALEVAIPLRDFFDYAKNVEVVQDTIIDIDAPNNLVVGSSDSKYVYDYLIMALGNVTEYYGIKGLKQHAYGMKTIHEALELKRNLHEQLLANDIEKNYVVVGAGPSGVELSAELVSYVKRVRKKHRIRRAFTIDLIEASPRPLSMMPEDVSKTVLKQLKKLGVRVKVNTAVKHETIDTLQLPKGRLDTHTAIWTAGIINNPLFKKFPKLFKLGRLNRVEVDEYLQAAPNIFVIGDSALTTFSGMAQTAIHNASFVAKNITRKIADKPMKKYKPKKPVYAVPVGPRWAVVLWGNIRIYGKLGWLLRRFADLKVFLTFLPLKKALTVWSHGFIDEEACASCKIKMEQSKQQA